MGLAALTIPLIGNPNMFITNHFPISIKYGIGNPIG
jgi:hypothetical protein